MAVEKVSVNSHDRCQIRGCKETAAWQVSWDESDLKLFRMDAVLLGEFNPDAFAKGEGFAHMYMCLMCNKHLSRFGLWA